MLTASRGDEKKVRWEKRQFAYKNKCRIRINCSPGIRNVGVKIGLFCFK